MKGETITMITAGTILFLVILFEESLPELITVPLGLVSTLILAGAFITNFIKT